jgi:hypothetical protein
VEAMTESPVTASVLRERLTDLLEGDLTLEGFDEWFALNTWEDSNVSLDARQLASAIELVLAELTSGHWTWAEARLELESLTHRVEAVWGGATITTTGTNVREVIRVAMSVLQSEGANIQYGEVCV